MKKFAVLNGMSSAVIAALIVTAFSQSGFAQTEFEKTAQDMIDMAGHLRAEKIKEEMRDKSHEGRIKAGDDSSVGIDRKGIGFRKVFLLNTRF